MKSFTKGTCESWYGFLHGVRVAEIALLSVIVGHWCYTDALVIIKSLRVSCLSCISVCYTDALERVSIV
jgi:hypothetical protein